MDPPENMECSSDPTNEENNEATEELNKVLSNIGSSSLDSLIAEEVSTSNIEISSASSFLMNESLVLPDNIMSSTEDVENEAEQCQSYNVVSSTDERKNETLPPMDVNIEPIVVEGSSSAPEDPLDKNVNIESTGESSCKTDSEHDNSKISLKRNINELDLQQDSYLSSSKKVCLDVNQQSCEISCSEGNEDVLFSDINLEVVSSSEQKEEIFFLDDDNCSENKNLASNVKNIDETEEVSSSNKASKEILESKVEENKINVELQEEICVEDNIDDSKEKEKTVECLNTENCDIGSSSISVQPVIEKDIVECVESSNNDVNEKADLEIKECLSSLLEKEMEGIIEEDDTAIEESSNIKTDENKQSLNVLEEVCNTEKDLDLDENVCLKDYIIEAKDPKLSDKIDDENILKGIPNDSGIVNITEASTSNVGLVTEELISDIAAIDDTEKELDVPENTSEITEDLPVISQEVLVIPQVSVIQHGVSVIQQEMSVIQQELIESKKYNNTEISEKSKISCHVLSDAHIPYSGKSSNILKEESDIKEDPKEINILKDADKVTNKPDILEQSCGPVIEDFNIIEDSCNALSEITENTTTDACSSLKDYTTVNLEDSSDVGILQETIESKDESFESLNETDNATDGSAKVQQLANVLEEKSDSTRDLEAIEKEMQDTIKKAGPCIPKKLDFKESLKEVLKPSNEDKMDVDLDTSSIHKALELPKIKASVISSSDLLEADMSSKFELSSMEIDSTNCTRGEESLMDTPCDSGETSPCISTPLDSCQVSAAPSPILKDEGSLTTDPTFYDESSVDTKDVNLELKEVEDVKPTKGPKRKGKKAKAESKKLKSKISNTPVLVDEETRMSGIGPSDIMDEDSRGSTGTTKREVRRFRCEVVVPESTEVFTVDKLIEYMWPLDNMGELYFLQEQVAQYLSVMSFKRKYPDLRRRATESQEKEYLKERGIVSEIACDLGLTAVRSEDVLDVLFNDFPQKFEELQRVLRERKEKQLKEKGKVDYQVVNLDKSKMKEYSRKAALNASKWNAAFNRDRHEERRYSFDLQTFTLHMPISRYNKENTTSKLGSYPIPVLPGQYTDFYKRYTPEELRSLPLQTVLTGPLTAAEIAAEAQADVLEHEETEVKIEGVPPIEIKKEEENGTENCVTPATAVADPLSAEKQPRCKVCSGGCQRNKDGKPEALITCSTCRTPSHPTCIDLSVSVARRAEASDGGWQCMDCKTCAQCADPDDEEKMIFCDMCDRGYHIYCVGLRKVPTGRWHCKDCAECSSCGSRSPSGSENLKNAEWQHEFKKDKLKQLKYACTLCVPCDRLWKRRQFCSVCLKVYRSIPEDGMVRCSACPKYAHKEECSVLYENERFCLPCHKGRNNTALNHSRIIAAGKKKMATTPSPMWLKYSS